VRRLGTGDRFVKLFDLTTSEPLSDKALAEAVKRVGESIHDGYADLTVHQAQLRKALKLAGEHNEKSRGMRIRVLTDTRLGHDDWRLRTVTAEVRVQRELA
jgi:hypothetical protein